MLPRLDDNGDALSVKTVRKNGRTVREERQKIETFQEFYIEDLTAINDLISMFAVNAKSFDYNNFLKSEDKAVKEKKNS